MKKQKQIPKELIIKTEDIGNFSLYGTYPFSSITDKHYEYNSAHLKGKGIIRIAKRITGFPGVVGYVEVWPICQEIFSNVVNYESKDPPIYPKQENMSDDEHKKLLTEYYKKSHEWFWTNAKRVFTRYTCTKFNCNLEEISKFETRYNREGYINKFWEDMEKLDYATRNLNEIWDRGGLFGIPIIRINFKGLLLGLQDKLDQPRAYIYPYSDFIMASNGITGNYIPIIRGGTLVKFGNLSNEDWDSLDEMLKKSKIDKDFPF